MRRKSTIAWTEKKERKEKKENKRNIDDREKDWHLENFDKRRGHKNGKEKKKKERKEVDGRTNNWIWKRDR